MSGAEAAGFDEFVMSRAAHLFALAYGITGERASAERLTEHALRRVKRDWRRSESTDDRLAAARRGIVGGYVAAGKHAAIEGPGGLELEDVAFTPAEARPSLGETGDLWTRLATLTPTERIIVVLRHQEGLTDHETARILRCRPSTVRDTAARVTVDLAADASHLRSSLNDHKPPDYDARALVRRLGGEATSGNRASRRRPALIATAVALAVLVGGLTYGLNSTNDPARVGGPALDATPDGTPAVGAPKPAPLPTPRGTTPVGYGTLMLAVPGSWAHNALRCGRPTADTVIYADEIAAIRGTGVTSAPHCSPAPTSYSTVTFSSSSLAGPPEVLHAAGAAGEVNGVRVLMSRLTHEDGRFQESIEVAADGLIVSVLSPRRAVVRDIVRSLTQVPAGYAVVPLCVGLAADKATAELGLRGLIGHTSEDSRGSANVPMQVVTQAPRVGTIVPSETVVALGVLPT